MRYYVKKDDDGFLGPLTEAQLTAHIRAGAISPDSLATQATGQSEGHLRRTEHWIRVGKIVSHSEAADSGSADGPGPSPVTTQASSVVVTAIRMSFGAMVVFMVKWAIASIPAAIILIVVYYLTVSVLVGLLGS